MEETKTKRAVSLALPDAMNPSRRHDEYTNKRNQHNELERKDRPRRTIWTRWQ